jgi:penicillin-binding protein 1A
LRTALVLAGLALLAFVSWIFGIMMAVAQDLPELENRAQYAAAKNSVVYDVENRKIATLTNNEGRILLESAEISASMKEAVVAIEDERFYGHRGIDFQGIGRAVYQDILSGSASQGASTITQQFVKNALAAQQERTIFQKLREAALAYHLERQWSKDKILTEYLNSIYFGEGAYGIEAAARTYFGWAHPGCGREGKESCASQLLPWESALLAGLISSPSGYSPRANPDAALERRNLVLQQMASQGSITEEEYAQYTQQKIPAAGDLRPPEENSEAPYFTSWLRQQLVDQYGAGQAFGGGLEVHSTLDLELQEQVEGIVDRRVGAIAPTSAVVVLDNETAGVRAMIGGSDFEKEPFNLATQGHRQPGSAFKPFTLVTALAQGRSSDEVFTSAPQKIPFRAKVSKKGGGERIVNELFPVDNYEDQYLGSASIATATTYSDNSVYSQLGTQVGPANVAETAAKLGVETDLSTETEYSIDDGAFEPYNPALILGGLETGVTPLEMAHAYNTLEQEGKRVSGTLAASEGAPLAINKVVEDDGLPSADGEVVETKDGEEGENKVETKQAIDPEVANTATSILTSVVTAGTGESAATGEPTWGKTGTTDNNGDAWFVGATDDVTVAVWVGHANSVTPMETEYNGGPVDGGTIPALIFAEVINAWEELQASRGVDEDEEATEVPTAPIAPAAPPTEAPAPVPEEPAPEPQPQAPPTPGDEPPGGGGGEGGGDQQGGTDGA